MKAYLIATGTLFTLIVIAHVWRMSVETNLLRQPEYYGITLIAAAFAFWGLRLFRRANARA